MRSFLLVLVPALFAATGCAQGPTRSDQHGLATQARTLVLVNVEDGQRSVLPDPAPFVGASNGVIKWVLVLDPADYVFPDEGIVFSRQLPDGKTFPSGCTRIGDPDARFRNCKPSRDRTEFQCSVTGSPHLPPGLCYHYLVKLVRVGGTGPADIVIDPWAKPK